MKYYAIIVAGGKGTRMKSAVPKQFMLLAGKPVLMHSIENFCKAIPGIIVTVVLPKDDLRKWNSLCRKYSFRYLHYVVTGGSTRYQSVKNALADIDNDGWVAVHDGVRPLADVTFIKECFDEAKKKGNAVPYIPLHESLRKIKGKRNKVISRDSIVVIQTPQIFQVKILKQAYKANYKKKFTDDASVAEQHGIKINLIQGAKKNIKITMAEDLLIAEALLKKK